MTKSKRCSRCKIAKPVADFGIRVAALDGLHPYCKACVRAYCKARYVKHAEQIKTQVREYRIRNAEEIKRRARAQYAADKPKFTARIARYYEQNRNDLAAAARERRVGRDKEAEGVVRRAWRAANRDLRREQEHRRRAHKLGTMVIPVTRAMLDAKVNYWGRKCWVCSGPFEAIDHVKPLSKGGSHILANLRPICGSCNSKKHSTWPYAPLRSTA